MDGHTGNRRHRRRMQLSQAQAQDKPHFFGDNEGGGGRGSRRSVRHPSSPGTTSTSGHRLLI